MLPTSARPASTIFVVFGTSGVHSVKSLLQHWCMPLWCLASTTATLSSPGLQRQSHERATTRQLVWSVVARSSTVAWRSWYTPSFIGSTYPSVSSNINSAWSRDGVWTVLLLSTWLLTAFQCLWLHRGSICVLLHQSSAGSTGLSTGFLWTSDLLCCRSDDMELFATTSVFARLLTCLFSEY